jgi:geranylgeranylglycerol-phosphate geranylgeranyltransferase
MTGLRAFVRLTRPQNVVIAGVAVLVGGAVGPGPVASWGLLAWAMVSAGLITAGGNTLNDVADVRIDRVNKPDRPLASGAIGIRSGIAFSVLLFAGGLAAAYPLPTGCWLIALLAVALICLYDLWGKGQPLTGNGLVAVVSSMAFVYGGAAVGQAAWGVIPGGLAFFFHLAREIIKDLEDMHADRTVGLRTWPIVVGERGARLTAQVALFLLLIVLFVPSLAGWLGSAYLVIALAGVGVPVALVIRGLAIDREAAYYGRLAVLLKWDMLVGLAAVLAG